ncbi:ATP-binding protein [Flavobacterium paronense]|uniref:histidine kinase n=1 Tax=Flavobacterium paronense TaxID=1392775 RepID=A0ABV5GHU8_9FLAO|nr:ATP-binding protein [Flavobacterium paronense]MDN3677240.1 ATP-binding protein [Flavobacterium paronense]
MENQNIHRQLQRQINKYLSDDLIAENEALSKFINVVNLSYLSYERDAELFEQSSRLNDVEYFQINQRLKGELAKKEEVHGKLIYAINQLNDKKVKLGEEDNLIELLNILNKEIDFKKEFQKQLFVAKSNAEKANEAKSDFLSIMSHEIRTPLNAIIGLIYIMEKENSLSSFQENIEVLKHSAQNLYLLINDILDFNKIEAGKIELENIPFDLKELITQIGKSLQVKATENSNKIEIEFDKNFTPNIISDPLRIGQILTNLVSNAIKFTDNGVIKIKVNQLETNQNNSKFKIQVIDNGIGIELDKFQQIFQKFEQAEKTTTRKFGGTGLGLVISKKLLQLLDSDIELQSEIGKGSNFSFVLNVPYFTNSSDLKSDILYHDYIEENLEGLRVLLVEDNLINVKVAEKILSQWNVTVDVALNGLIATEKYEPGKYDIVLMDLAMPIMDGYEATINIRFKDISIPIIALTASASYGYLEKAMLLGINEYIIKPFNPKELNLKLRKHYKSKDE